MEDEAAAGASSHVDLPSHRLAIALISPQIAPNTGNVARLCVAMGSELHLVRPLGFVLSDRELRRSAMDYWPRLRLIVHDDTPGFFETMKGRRFWFFTSQAERGLWDVRFADGDCLVFGNETHGLSEQIIARDASAAIRIPQAQGERCLNLSTAVGIGAYEALRQICGES